MLFPFSLAGAARRWLEKEPPRSILTWEDLVSKFINEFFPPSRTTNLRNEISNFEQRFGESFHEAWDRYKDLLRACPHHGFTELHQLDTFYNALNPTDQDSLNSAVLVVKLLNGSTQIVDGLSKTNSSKSANKCCDYRHDRLLSNNFSIPNSMLPLKAVEEIYVTCGGAHPYYQCLAADGNTFRDNIQGYVSAAAVNYNKEDERVEETLTDPKLAEYTIKVPPPLVQKAKPTSLKNYVVHKRDPLHPNIPYPSRMHQEKQQEKDEVQIHKFWQMFKQLHINISLANALILILKYQKMLKSLLSNKEKHLELANTPLNKNCSVVILKKLPEKLGDRRKFLIPCSFSELKCKALADLGASINLMPLSVWKKLGLPELISTRMTLELANRAICTPAGIARDVFVPVGKFTFPADFVIVDYESDPRVFLILGRPFLQTARALIDVHGEEMILRDGDERLILNMRHDTSSYSNKPKKESINMIDIYNVSHKDYLEDLFANEKATNHSTYRRIRCCQDSKSVLSSIGGRVSEPAHWMSSCILDILYYYDMICFDRSMISECTLKVVRYHAVPAPYIGNFMPPKYDLILADEGEYVFSKSITSISDAATSKAKTSVSKPKSVGEPLIEDWISKSEDENETEFKSK
ncbi:reverse transcriptase domain-containing protein [Tanacetum coccineum]